MTAVLVALGVATPAYAGDPTPSGVERHFVGLLNQERAVHDLAPVEISPNLTDVADDYAAFYSESGAPIDHAHDPPYTARAHGGGCSGWDGPVLAQGYTSPRAALDGWLGSPGHRAVLLDPTITHMGAGFDGDYQLAFGLTCEPNALNTSGDFGAVKGIYIGTPTVRGKSIRVALTIASGQTSARLIARRGRRVVRGPRKSAAIGDPIRVTVRVPVEGKWRLWVNAEGRKHPLGKVKVP